MPALVSPLGPDLPGRGRADHRALVEALAGPYRALPFGQRPEDWMEGGVDCGMEAHGSGAGEIASAGDGARGGAGDAMATTDGAENVEATSDGAETAEPARPLRYRVQFTANQEFVDLLREVTDLLGHETPRVTLPDVQLRALRILVKELRARKRATTSRPRSARVAREEMTAGTTEDELRAAPERAKAKDTPVGAAPERAKAKDTTVGAAPERASAGDECESAAAETPERATSWTPDAERVRERLRNRHIPAAVLRTVWRRDAARCAYVDDRGVRCRETCGLEVHHRQAFALGGPSTTANLELCCRAHNTLAAEQDFGRGHMDAVRGAACGAPQRDEGRL
jgi:hypothetical protein